eukprot:CAMPEP_0182416694 /NCGR_PEP_ID=MMETSP1167-20130531/1065_1 /TAXON_ID=2988 /ORGANISM="Mallomonas Sp, Strain CCMP3275" /LENGTH=157 /DNA_ID=CAMNT_0024589701 /DNA_START=180 /DNA_END=653 /DNA_ORIENTATION=+
MNRSKISPLLMVSEGEVSAEGSEISPWLRLDTRGGVVVWSTILIVIPLVMYYYLVGTGIEETKVGAYVGAAFVLISMLAWASTYIFRVATKDMTYARQLRDYENAVLQKRLDELADDEIQALMEEIDEEENESIPLTDKASSVTMDISQSPNLPSSE